jgi:tricorn protease
MAGFTGRNMGDNSALDQAAIDGPKCMLINQYAGSGGDLFPWMFRQAGLGPLIGKRTWGGLVGISGLSDLADGGGITAPEFGLFDKDLGEWIAENKGVDPDIDVDLRPDLLAKGQDAQLDAAIKYLMDELKKPRKPFKRPPYPVMKPGGG